tara:strand:+ start:610 stop:759 length:150 start_codon:yes stop_codon:yes gene_type:complete
MVEVFNTAIVADLYFSFVYLSYKLENGLGEAFKERLLRVWGIGREKLPK